MLTPRENLIEVMKGGKPDRFANQYEPFGMVFTPVMMHWGKPKPGELNKVNCWGVTESWGEGQPGAFPVHTPDKIVIKDIEHWKDYVKAPTLDFPEAEWDMVLEQQVSHIDTKEKFLMPFVAPGIFEESHYLGEIKNILMAFYEYPDEMHELIKFLLDWELRLAEVTCDHIHPDGMFHHDDWGTQASTFMRPEMFAEFFLEPYKELYSYWKSRGVKLIVHHSDSYAQTLVPYMIEMGIDVWQGVMTTNDIPAMIKEYGDRITFMGGINSATVDHAGWTPEEIKAEVKRACDEYGPYHYICGASQGLGMSTFPGVYDEMTKDIDEYSKVYWKEHNL